MQKSPAGVGLFYIQDMLIMCSASNILRQISPIIVHKSSAGLYMPFINSYVALSGLTDFCSCITTIFAY